MNDVSQVVYALGRQEAGGLTLLGTAFAVGPNKVATAYHVTGASDEGLAIVIPRFPNLLAYQDTSDTRVNTVPLRIVAADPLKDLCVLEFAAPDAQISVNYGLSSTDGVPPGAPVVTLGFPHANFGRMVLTQQVAHVGARILIENSGQKSKHIVLNTQARDGQSGGPVFDQGLGSVVAVVLGSYAPGGGGGISLGGGGPGHPSPDHPCDLGGVLGSHAVTVADPLESLLSGAMDEWLAALPTYQRQSIAALLGDHEAVDVATIWLENSGPKDTAPFGGVRTAANNFYDNILKELQKAICGGEEYATERKELADATKSGGKLLLVGALSTAIAPHVGAAAAVIGPAVAITLGIVANAGTATACEALQDLIDRRASSPAEGATEAE